MVSNISSRFWAKVVQGTAPGACWVWVGAIGADGYGRFWVKDPESEAGEKMWRAHRYAATLTFGSDAVEAAEMVTHLCDNPLCVRAEAGPESHPFLGDHSENMRERAADSRALRERVLKHALRLCPSGLTPLLEAPAPVGRAPVSGSFFSGSTSPPPARHLRRVPHAPPTDDSPGTRRTSRG